MITITEAAQSKIQEIISEETDPNIKLRMLFDRFSSRKLMYLLSIEESVNHSKKRFLSIC